MAENSIHSVIGPTSAPARRQYCKCITKNLRPSRGRGVVRGHAYRRADAGSRVAAVGISRTLSEHPPVPQHHRIGQSAGWHASAAAFHLVGRSAAHAAHHARRDAPPPRRRCACCTSSACVPVATRWCGNLANGEQAQAGRSAVRWPPNRNCCCSTNRTVGHEPSEMMDFIQQVRAAFRHHQIPNSNTRCAW